MTSPLARARETAALLGFADPPSDARLAEMALGQFRGPHADGAAGGAGPGACAISKAPGSISGRPAARARGWSPSGWPRCLRDLAVTGSRPCARDAQGRAARLARPGAGWDMLGKPPVRYEPERALIYGLAPTGDADVRGQRAAGHPAHEPQLALPVLGPEPPGLRPSAPRPAAGRGVRGAVARRSSWSMAARRAHGRRRAGVQLVQLPPVTAKDGDFGDLVDATGRPCRPTSCAQSGNVRCLSLLGHGSRTSS